MKFIVIDSKTHGTHSVIVDDEDFEFVNQFKWSVSKKKYITRKISNGPSFSIHREVMKKQIEDFLHSYKGLDRIVIDHINQNPLDNRKENLRIVTQSENQMNKKGNSDRLYTSKYKGVYWRKDSKKWRVAIKLNQKSISIGCYKNEIDAAEAYNLKAIELFGEFAYLNEVA